MHYLSTKRVSPISSMPKRQIAFKAKKKQLIESQNNSLRADNPRSRQQPRKLTTSNKARRALIQAAPEEQTQMKLLVLEQPPQQMFYF